MVPASQHGEPEGNQAMLGGRTLLVASVAVIVRINVPRRTTSHTLARDTHSLALLATL
jgi:hypothetical protein